MSVSNNRWNRLSRSGRATLLTSAVIMIVAVVGLFGVTQSAGAAKSSSYRCYGTYLMLENSGAQSLWSFDSRGTLQTTSSAEDFTDGFNTGFSHAQGAYERTKGGIVKTTALDFALDNAVVPTSIARIDGELIFSKGCQDVTGSFDLRFYPAGHDPLDIDDYSFKIDDFTVIGRLVTTD